MLSNTSRSTSPVGKGLRLRALVAPGAKSLGMGGNTFVLAGDGDGGETSISTEGEAVTPFSTTGDCWYVGTLKNDDDPLERPEGRSRRSLSTERSRSFDLLTNESLDAFFTIEGRGVEGSPDPVDE